MDYKYKSVGEHPPLSPPPPPSMMVMGHAHPPMSYPQQQSLTYFSQQAIRAGYVAPHFENKLGHIQHQPANMREAIQREIEKERIKEEIIAEEIARRNMLELEVRRELMMERQLAKQSGAGLSPFSSPVMSFSPTLPLLKQQSVVRSADERIARSLDDRMESGISVSRLGARNETGRLEIVPFEERISEIPFQQRSVEPKISALEPVSHSLMPMISELQSPLVLPSKEKDKIILLAKPNTSISGAKRKAVSPTVEIVNQPPSFDVTMKNDKQDWSCALCQVSATSERGLNDHLRGKKHKSKEAALLENRIGKNYSIGLFPKKPKIINLPEANGNLNVEQMVKPKVELLVQNKSGEGSSLVILEKEGAKDAITPPLQPHADDMNKSANEAPKKQKTKKKKFPYWCATCKVGAFSEVSLEAHRVGKKHRARLLALSSAATSATNVESTQTVNEASEDVEETEVIDEVGAGVDSINPDEQEEVLTTGDN